MHLQTMKEMRPYYLADANGTPGHTPFDVLSKKELEVLRHLSKGESPVRISRIMDISSSTISTHKANLSCSRPLGIRRLKEGIDHVKDECRRPYRRYLWRAGIRKGGHLLLWHQQQ